MIAEAPRPSREIAFDGTRALPFTAAFADHEQAGFPAANVLDDSAGAAGKGKKGKANANDGWAVGGAIDQPHQLTLIPDKGVQVAAGSRLVLTIDQKSSHKEHVLGRFRISCSPDASAATLAGVPPKILAIVRTPADKRDATQSKALADYYLSIAPALEVDRIKLAEVQKKLAEAKPESTVPVMKELPVASRRKTQLQHRGNFLDLGQEVSPGVPAIFPQPKSGEAVDRLALAKWLVDPDNPLTPRVVVNQYWEQIFGVGLVRTSEEFGSQGELPSHPELLDFLATEIIRLNWDTKALLKQIVMSAAYRQSSKVTPEAFERDPENRLLARGPRFRLSAETIRDQALFVSGLLSSKMYGPPAKPPQPAMGLSAAFGGGIDWQTSAGEDKYRRGLYTTWRRSNPYPSMTTFDAPNREVCTVRRTRTNTPLQALVVLNDPVYLEAAQSLARKMAAAGATPEEHLREGFRRVLSRSPEPAEAARLLTLYEQLRADYEKSPEAAKAMATKPLGPLPGEWKEPELAAWTGVANVLLNLDEFLMKR